MKQDRRQCSPSSGCSPSSTLTTSEASRYHRCWWKNCRRQPVTCKKVRARREGRRTVADDTTGHGGQPDHDDIIRDSIALFRTVITGDTEGETAILTGADLRNLARYTVRLAHQLIIDSGGYGWTSDHDILESL